MSLPHVLGTTLETIPHQVPYLAVPEDCTLQLVDRKRTPDSTAALTSESGQVQRFDRPLNIGIVWTSVSLTNPKQRKSYRNRTAPLEAFMNGLSHLNVELYSLQVGAHAADIAQYGFQHCLHDLSPQFRDFAETATAIDQLDPIITVDTAVAHLVGALAKPVWVVLPFASDWGWLLHREDSPWYPTMRLFRQASPCDWAGVMATVARTLSEMTCV